MFYRSRSLLMTLCLGGCVTIQTVTIDEKTALELQLIGEREVWDDQAALEMSKRDTEQVIAPGFSKLLDARDAQRFLQDEWFSLLSRNCASFGEEETLQIDCRDDQEALGLWEREQVLRTTIFTWLYDHRSYFAGLDKGEAKKVFDSLMDRKLANAYAAFQESVNR
jgi:hypothetical protein